MGLSYLCHACNYEWVSRKSIGIPSSCPHCRGYRIESHMSIRAEKLRLEELKRKKELRQKERLKRKKEREARYVILKKEQPLKYYFVRYWWIGLIILYLIFVFFFVMYVTNQAGIPMMTIKVGGVPIN